MIKIGTALFEAAEQLEREKGISKDVLVSSLCDALVAGYKKHIKDKDADNVEAILDEESGEIGVFRTKLVVENVEDPDTQISLEDAKEIDDEVELEDEVKIEVTPEDFGRIAAQSAKQVITQRIREAERKLVLDEFMSKKGTLITGIIQRRDDRNVIVNIGKTDFSRTFSPSAFALRAAAKAKISVIGMMASVRVSLTITALSNVSLPNPYRESQTEAAAVTEEVSLTAVPAKIPNASPLSVENPSSAPNEGKISAARRLKKKMTETACATSPSFAFTTGAAAAIAEPPQIADPTPTNAVIRPGIFITFPRT